MKNNRIETPPRVALYTRISTDEDHQKYSLDAQRDRLEAYSKVQYDEFSVFKIYRDTSTGTNMNRPGLEQMLADVEAKRFDVLMVFRVDRLSRNVRQLAQMVELLTDNNVVLRSATEPFDTANAAGKMMMQMLGVFAEFEHATIVERTRAGMERKAKNGEWCGGFVPYGYQRVEGQILIEESETAIVTKIFRNYVYGQKGTTNIAEELNRTGIRKRRGLMWDNRGMILILKNPFYTGVIRWKDKMFEGKHEAIISQEMFDKAHAILESRNVAPRGERFSLKSDYFLTGMIECGQCGKGLVGRAGNRNGHRHKYYSCSNRAYHKGCKLPFIRADNVEVLTIKEINAIFGNPELLQKVWNLVNEQLQADLPAVISELNKIYEDVVKTKSALERYFNAFETGNMDEEAMKTRITDLNTRLQQLEEEKANLEGQLSESELAALDQDAIRTYLGALEAVLADGVNEQKKHLLRVLVEKVIAHGRDKFEFWFKLPDGSTIYEEVKNATDGTANSLSVNQLVPSVCNQEHVAPRTYKTANGRWCTIIMSILIQDGRPRHCEFPNAFGKLGLV